MKNIEESRVNLKEFCHLWYGYAPVLTQLVKSQLLMQTILLKSLTLFMYAALTFYALPVFQVFIKFH